MPRPDTSATWQAFVNSAKILEKELNCGPEMARTILAHIVRLAVEGKPVEGKPKEQEAPC